MYTQNQTTVNQTKGPQAIQITNYELQQALSQMQGETPAANRLSYGQLKEKRMEKFIRMAAPHTQRFDLLKHNYFELAAKKIRGDAKAEGAALPNGTIILLVHHLEDERLKVKALILRNENVNLDLKMDQQCFHEIFGKLAKDLKEQENQLLSPVALVLLGCDYINPALQQAINRRKNIRTIHQVCIEVGWSHIPIVKEAIAKDAENQWLLSIFSMATEKPQTCPQDLQESIQQASQSWSKLPVERQGCNLLAREALPTRLGVLNIKDQNTELKNGHRQEDFPCADMEVNPIQSVNPEIILIASKQILKVKRSCQAGLLLQILDDEKETLRYALITHTVSSQQKVWNCEDMRHMEEEELKKVPKLLDRSVQNEIVKWRGNLGQGRICNVFPIVFEHQQSTAYAMVEAAKRIRSQELHLDNVLLLQDLSWVQHQGCIYNQKQQKPRLTSSNPLPRFEHYEINGKYKIQKLECNAEQTLEQALSAWSISTLNKEHSKALINFTIRNLRHETDSSHFQEIKAEVDRQEKSIKNRKEIKECREEAIRRQQDMLVLQETSQAGSQNEDRTSQKSESRTDTESQRVNVIYTQEQEDYNPRSSNSQQSLGANPKDILYHKIRTFNDRYEAEGEPETSLQIPKLELQREGMKHEIIQGDQATSMDTSEQQRVRQQELDKELEAANTTRNQVEQEFYEQVKVLIHKGIYSYDKDLYDRQATTSAADYLQTMMKANAIQDKMALGCDNGLINEYAARQMELSLSVQKSLAQVNLPSNIFSKIAENDEAVMLLRTAKDRIEGKVVTDLFSLEKINKGQKDQVREEIQCIFLHCNEDLEKYQGIEDEVLEDQQHVQKIASQPEQVTPTAEAGKEAPTQEEEKESGSKRTRKSLNNENIHNLGVDGGNIQKSKIVKPKKAPGVQAEEKQAERQIQQENESMEEVADEPLTDEEQQQPKKIIRKRRQEKANRKQHGRSRQAAEVEQQGKQPVKKQGTWNRQKAKQRADAKETIDTWYERRLPKKTAEAKKQPTGLESCYIDQQIAPEYENIPNIQELRLQKNGKAAVKVKDHFNDIQNRYSVVKQLLQLDYPDMPSEGRQAMRDIVRLFNELFTRTELVSRRKIYKLLLEGDHQAKPLNRSLLQIWEAIRAYSDKAARDQSCQLRKAMSRARQTSNGEIQFPNMDTFELISMIGAKDFLTYDDHSNEEQKLHNELLYQVDQYSWIDKGIESSLTLHKKNELLRAKGEFQTARKGKSAQETILIHQIQDIHLGVDASFRDPNVHVTVKASKSKGVKTRFALQIPAAAILHQNNGYPEIQEKLTKLVSPYLLPYLSRKVELSMNQIKDSQTQKISVKPLVLDLKTDYLQYELVTLSAALMASITKEEINNRDALAFRTNRIQDSYMTRICKNIQRRYHQLQKTAAYQELLTEGQALIFQENLYGSAVQPQGVEDHYQPNYGRKVENVTTESPVMEAVNQYFGADVLTSPVQLYQLYGNSKKKNSLESSANLIFKGRLDIASELCFITKHSSHYLKLNFRVRTTWNEELLLRFQLFPELFQYHLCQLRINRMILLVYYNADTHRKDPAEYYCILYDQERGFTVKEPEEEQGSHLFGNQAGRSHNQSTIDLIWDRACLCQVLVGVAQPATTERAVLTSQQRQIQLGTIAKEYDLPNTVNHLAAASQQYAAAKVKIEHMTRNKEELAKELKNQNIQATKVEMEKVEEELMPTSNPPSEDLCYIMPKTINTERFMSATLTARAANAKLYVKTAESLIRNQATKLRRYVQNNPDQFPEYQLRVEQQIKQEREEKHLLPESMPKDEEPLSMSTMLTTTGKSTAASELAARGEGAKQEKIIKIRTKKELE